MIYFEALLSGLPFFISHFFLTLFLLFFGVAIYILLTPIKEISLIKSGNVAAAISFSGALLGIGIPLASSLSVSNSLVEIFVWGITAILIQLLCYKLTDTFLSDLEERINKGELATAILLFSIKISVSLVNAAAIVG
tara:strand:- start:523 stop:933 length:411 start_codon:yes stop_codon:yes gene_type:complete